MKVYLELTGKDSKGVERVKEANLAKFFALATDATKKFYSLKDLAADAEPEPIFQVKAAAMTRALTVIGEGIFTWEEIDQPSASMSRKEADGREILDTHDIFEMQGFTQVDKLEED